MSTRRQGGNRQGAPWGSLAREDIVRTAIGEARGSGFEQMTIRRLASALGVAPMSLYRHIRSKDDLLDDVADELLRRAWHAPDPAMSWRENIAIAAEDLRRLLVTEPAVLHVYLRHPVVSPSALERMESMLGLLREGGLDDPSAASAYATIQTYTIGFAALEASRLAHLPKAESSKSSREDDLMRQIAAYTEPAQFDRGLQYLLDGIAQHHLDS